MRIRSDALMLVVASRAARHVQLPHVLKIVRGLASIEGIVASPVERPAFDSHATNGARRTLPAAISAPDSVVNHVLKISARHVPSSRMLVLTSVVQQILKMLI
jgi:hypothetical protein